MPPIKMVSSEVVFETKRFHNFFQSNYIFIKCYLYKALEKAELKVLVKKAEYARNKYEFI